MFGFLKARRALGTPEHLLDAVWHRLERSAGVTGVARSTSGGMALDVTTGAGVRRFALEDLAARIAEVAGDERAERGAVRQYVSAFLSALDDPIIDLDRVYPLLRHEDYVAPLQGAGLTGAFAGDLVVAATLDMPEALVTISRDMAEEANLAHAEIWGAARVNAASAMTGLTETPQERGTTRLSLDKDWLGLSILTDAKALHHARQRLGAEAIFISGVSRDGLEIIDSTAAGAFETIKAVVLEGAAGDHPQSGCIFTLAENDPEPVAGWRLQDGSFRPLG